MVSREGVEVNTFGVIENTLGLFKISFEVLHFSADKLPVRFPRTRGLLTARW